MSKMNKTEECIGRDCYAIVDFTPSKKVILVNPKALESENECTLTKRLLSTFSKYEIENWVARNILSAVKEAIANDIPVADLSKLASASFEMYDYQTDSIDWQITNDRFRKIFISLPFFEVEENCNHIRLKFIA